MEYRIAHGRHRCSSCCQSLAGRLRAIFDWDLERRVRQAMGRAGDGLREDRRRVEEAWTLNAVPAS